MARQSHFQSIIIPIIAMIAFAGILYSGLVSSCSNIRIGWVGNNYPGRINAHFNTFTGTEDQSFQANAGQTIALTYDVSVEKGTLALKLEGPGDDNLWENTFDENAQDTSDTIVIRLPQTGRYTILIIGADAGGSFDVSWRVS